ncbi:hypothetical protein HMPREF9543_02023 [Escherichia coli MS 146-1]|nr:hypothetical protein HMPREF9543_02023 [Escherichia coli MS 146-1]
MQKTRTMNYSPQFKHLRAHSNNNSYLFNYSTHLVSLSLQLNQ